QPTFARYPPAGGDESLKWRGPRRRWHRARAGPSYLKRDHLKGCFDWRPRSLSPSPRLARCPSPPSGSRAPLDRSHAAPRHSLHPKLYYLAPPFQPTPPPSHSVAQNCENGAANLPSARFLPNRLYQQGYIGIHSLFLLLWCDIYFLSLLVLKCLKTWQPSAFS